MFIFNHFTIGYRLACTVESVYREQFPYFHTSCGMGEPIPYGFIIFPVYHRSFRYIVGYRLACTVEFVYLEQSSLFLHTLRVNKPTFHTSMNCSFCTKHCVKLFIFTNIKPSSKHAKPQLPLNIKVLKIFIQT